MPLVLNPDSTVSGVYQGQDQPISIGEVPFDFGPHKIGFIQIDDSIVMQAYFDPSLSRKVTQHSDFYSNITYIQVGQFNINGTPMPVNLHNDTPPYPVMDEYLLYSHIPESSWVDICKYTCEQEVVKTPFYPLWILQNNNNFDITNLFKYPQRYGGFTRYTDKPFVEGDNLCSYMRSQVDLRLLDIPSFIPDYYENLDISGLVTSYVFPDQLPNNPGIGFPYGLDIIGIINYLVGQNVLPPLLPSLGLHMYPSRNNRYFVSYNTAFIRLNKSVTEQVNIVIYLNGDGKYYLSYMDYNVDVQYEMDKQQGLNTIPDLYALNVNIGTKIGHQFNFNMHPFNISYRFITYACAAVKTNEEQIHIKLLEGFWWQPGRMWPNGQPDILTFNGPGVTNQSDEQIFKRTVSKFLNDSGINVNWY